MFTLLPASAGNVLAARATGKLTTDDYQLFTSELESRIRQFGGVRVYLELEDFHGWDLGAAWADFTFGLKHLGQFQGCAIVGDRKWEEWLIDLGRPFFKVRYFDRSEKGEAWDWLLHHVEDTAPLGRNVLRRVYGFASQHPIAAVAGSVAAGFLLGIALRSRRPVFH